MAFYARNFVFDGVPSQTYNILITSSAGESVTQGSGQVKILRKPIFRRSVPYTYGISQGDSVLTFPCEISSPQEMGLDTARAISRWLFGRMDYAKLQIVQPDMLNVYYNCVLNNPKVKRVGGKIVGYTFDVVCDSPFAWEFDKTLSKTYTGETISDTFSFQNTSDDRDYLYPTTSFTINSFGGSLSILNSSDGGRETTLTGLAAGEVITMNNSLGILTSSTGILRMQNFNKKWFRLVPSGNSITISGNVASFSMAYRFARKAA